MSDSLVSERPASGLEMKSDRLPNQSVDGLRNAHIIYYPIVRPIFGYPVSRSLYMIESLVHQMSLTQVRFACKLAITSQEQKANELLQCDIPGDFTHYTRTTSD